MQRRQITNFSTDFNEVYNDYERTIVILLIEHYVVSLFIMQFDGMSATCSAGANVVGAYGVLLTSILSTQAQRQAAISFIYVTLKISTSSTNCSH